MLAACGLLAGLVAAVGVHTLAPGLRESSAARLEAEARGARDLLRLETQLRHPDPAVRVAACERLGTIERPEARAMLEGRLTDPDEGVRRAARAALAGSPLNR